jgi:hypothetical protein
MDSKMSIITSKKKKRRKCPDCKGSGVIVSAIDYPMAGFECFTCKWEYKYRRNSKHWKWNKQSAKWVPK